MAQPGLPLETTLYMPDDNADAPQDAHSGEAPVFSATEEVEGFPLNPDARRLFSVCPWMRKVPVFGKASAAYGPKTTVSLGVTYFMLKGIADQLVKATVYAMIVTRYGADATRYQRLTPMASLGWSIKAFTAMISDGLALFGYTKRWYIAISAVAGAVFALVYGLLPAKESSADIGGALIFLTSFCKANFDILAEGHYSRLMRRIPQAGSSLVTWIWLLILVGYIIASGMTGPLSDQKKPQICLFVAAALQLITVIFPIFNWYGEKTNRIERADDARMNYLDQLKEQQRQQERERAEALANAEAATAADAPAAGAAAAGEGEDKLNERQHHHSSSSDDGEVAMLAGVPQMDPAEKDLHPELPMELQNGENALADDLYAQDDAAGGYDITPPQTCCCGAFEVNKEVVTRDWKVFVYCAIMTCSVLAMTVGNILAPKAGVIGICAGVSILCCGLSFWALPMPIAKANVFGYLHMMVYLNIGALDNFYMATPACLPNGPHFSYTFYKTVGSIIGNVAGMLGVLGFNYIFSKRSYRVTFMVTASTQIIASVFDIIIVKRWNVSIGIPDHAMYICGDAVVYQVCYMLAWMPMVILLSRLCPRGSESVVYALVAGFANLGSSTSSVVTSILMEYAWPIKSTVPCNFDNLIWLVVVGHLCTPLLIFPLTLLLPGARCCDDLDVDGHATKRALKNKSSKASKRQSKLDRANAHMGNDMELASKPNGKGDAAVVSGIDAGVEPFDDNDNEQR